MYRPHVKTYTQLHTVRAHTPTHTHPHTHSHLCAPISSSKYAHENKQMKKPHCSRFTFGSRWVRCCCAAHCIRISLWSCKLRLNLLLLLLLLLRYLLVLCAIKFSFSHPLIFALRFFSSLCNFVSTLACSKHTCTNHRALHKHTHRNTHVERKHSHNARTTRRIHTPPFPVSYAHHPSFLLALSLSLSLAIKHTYARTSFPHCSDLGFSTLHTPPFTLGRAGSLLLCSLLACRTSAH